MPASAIFYQKKFVRHGIVLRADVLAGLIVHRDGDNVRLFTRGSD